MYCIMVAWLMNPLLNLGRKLKTTAAIGNVNAVSPKRTVQIYLFK